MLIIGKRKYGWKRSLPDHRVPRRYALRLVPTPPFYDMTPRMPPVYDQLTLGDCTGNALAGAVQFLRAKQGLPSFMPSRLFIYWNERVIEGTTSVDAGATVHDGVSTLTNLGACSETDWPYDPTQYAVQPPANCFTDAKTDLVSASAYVDQELDAMRECISSDVPIVFGVTVYDSFESQAVDSSGIVPMPGATEDSLGGHCMLIVGYDDANQQFIVRNSWGSGWGQAGYCRMPYSYLLNQDLAADFWQIDTIAPAAA